MRSYEWCAGLFIGEGCAGVRMRTSSADITRGYLALQLQMLDLRGVQQFAEALSLPYREYDYHLDRTRKMGRVHVMHARAVAAFNLMLPYMLGTAKGDQVLKAARECTDYKVVRNQIILPPRRTDGMRGNQNARKVS